MICPPCALVAAKGRTVACATFRGPGPTHALEVPLPQDVAPPPDDSRLVGAFLATRDEEAFRALFRRHTPALYRLALRLLGGDTAAAEDAVQETWIRATTRLPAFRFDSALRTWLCGFVVNCCRESRRRVTNHVTLSDHELLATAPPRSLDAVDLERALLGLADGYRQVLVLHDVMGFTHREIGDRLGIQEGTSKSQLFLARRALRLRIRPIEDRHE